MKNNAPRAKAPELVPRKLSSVEVQCEFSRGSQTKFETFGKLLIHGEKNSSADFTN